MDENQNFNNNVIDPNNPYNSPQDPNLNMNNGMYQDPNQMGADPNMMNQGMYQDPNQMGMDPNMMNQGMYQDPNQMGTDPNMMNQGMYQDPNQMGADPNMMNQGMYQDPNQMGMDPNMMNQGMYQDPNQMGADPNMMNQGMYQDPNQMGADPNMMNQGMYQDPNQMGADPNMMNQGMYQDPNQMGMDPNMMNQGMYQDPNAMGYDPNMMYQDPNAMGFDPNMMGPNPNSLNQNMQLDPSDPNSVINAPVPPAEGPAQTNANFNTDESNFSAPKPKSNKKTFLIIGIVLALIVLVLIILIATGVINIGGSEPQNVTENKVTPVANATPAPPAARTEQINFCEDYYFSYDANTWSIDNTTADASGNQIIQISDGQHTLKYDFNAKPIKSLFEQSGVDVGTSQGLQVLYEMCIATSQQNSVGQLGTLTALESGSFQLTNSQKLYYAFADLPDTSSTTAGDLAQNSTGGNASSSVVTRFYYIYLSAPTDDVVFFFELKNLDTSSEPEVHQNVLKILTSITKNASGVNTNTVGNTVANDLNDAATANAILENQVAADNEIVNPPIEDPNTPEPTDGQAQQQQQQQQQVQEQQQQVQQ